MVAEEFNMALELGGTLSGEHGVGALKRPYISEALGPLSIEIQRKIKDALDPNNILILEKYFQIKTQSINLKELKMSRPIHQKDICHPTSPTCSLRTMPLDG